MFQEDVFFLSYAQLLVGANTQKSACGHSWSYQTSPIWRRFGSSQRGPTFVSPPALFIFSRQGIPARCCTHGGGKAACEGARVQHGGQLPAPARGGLPSASSTACPPSAGLEKSPQKHYPELNGLLSVCLKLRGLLQ